MTKVTVDLHDLETVLFATGVVKTIEGALASRKNDPFVQPHLEFAAAHDRLASEMRNATRAEAGTLIAWDGALTEDEIELLRKISGSSDIYRIAPEEKAPEPGKPMSTVDSLAAKGCVVLGQLLRGILWADNPKPVLKADPAGFAVKITQRGLEKLKDTPNG